MTIFLIFFIVLFVLSLIILWMMLDYQYICMQKMLKKEHSVIEPCIDKVRAKET